MLCSRFFIYFMQQRVYVIPTFLILPSPQSFPCGNHNITFEICESFCFAATWMDPEMMIPSEVSQTEKDKYHMISLICGI